MDENKLKCVSVEEPKKLSPHTKAVYDAGANLIKESISTGREYCKSMIGISLSAIPIYIGLIKLYIPKTKLISEIINFGWLIPIILYLLSAVLFSFGYLPGHKVISLEIVDVLQEQLNKAIKRRFYFGVLGFVILIIGIGVSIFIISTVDN